MPNNQESSQLVVVVLLQHREDACQLADIAHEIESSLATSGRGPRSAWASWPAVNWPGTHVVITKPKMAPNVHFYQDGDDTSSSVALAGIDFLSTLSPAEVEAVGALCGEELVNLRPEAPRGTWIRVAQFLSGFRAEVDRRIATME